MTNNLRNKGNKKKLKCWDRKDNPWLSTLRRLKTTKKNTMKQSECQNKNFKTNFYKKYKTWNSNNCSCPKPTVHLSFCWTYGTNKSKKKNNNLKELKEWRVFTTRRIIIKRSSETFTRTKLKLSQNQISKNLSSTKNYKTTGSRSSHWVPPIFTSKASSTWNLSINLSLLIWSNKPK